LLQLVVDAAHASGRGTSVLLTVSFLQIQMLVVYVHYIYGMVS